MQTRYPTPPHEQRNFVHKRIIGGITGGIGSIVRGGNPFVGAARGFIGGGGSATPVPGRAQAPPIFGGFLQTTPGHVHKIELGHHDPGDPLQIGGTGGPGMNFPISAVPTSCAPGWSIGPTGRCQENRGGVVGAVQRFLPGGSTGLVSSEDGAPGPYVETIQRRNCGRGMVLGYNGRCYGKRNISNKDRFWPKPRRPLLTGGDLNAIATASRAAKRLQTTQKRLVKMGMLPKAKSGRRTPAHTHSTKVTAH